MNSDKILQVMLKINTLDTEINDIYDKDMPVKWYDKIRHLNIITDDIRNDLIKLHNESLLEEESK